MRRRNSQFSLVVVAFLTVVLAANAQSAAPAQQTTTPQTANPQATNPGNSAGSQAPASSSGSNPQAPDPSSQPSQPQAAPAPTAPVAAEPTSSTSQGGVQEPVPNDTPSGTQSPSPTPPPPNGSAGQSADSTDSGVFVFRKEVEEVVLHATVIDDKQRMVTNLERGAFQVFEDGQPQTITSFRHEDIPVAMGIVVDNSGSMREKRQKVNAAALNLVRASNPNDQVFIVNFNDEYYLDQDFTANINKLKEGLDKIEARGGTALYDALVASADHLKKSARLEKKVIFVVTDGEDNASTESLEQAVKRLQAENGPTVYSIGILGDEEHPRRAKRALEVVSERTGGIAFFPKTLDEVDAISRSVAHDIRNQYTIGYKPSTPKSQGGYRTVKVEAKSHGYGKLSVRTKSGYYAGQERASGGQ